jgi:hypothetical protein
MPTYSRTPMVYLDVKFTCEVCHVYVIRPIRVGPHFFLGADNMPEGWLVVPEEFAMRAWCPLHARDAK